MIRHYVEAALHRARYTQIEDGAWCAEVRGLKGVIATGDALEACRAQGALGRAGFSGPYSGGLVMIRSLAVLIAPFVVMGPNFVEVAL